MKKLRLCNLLIIPTLFLTLDLKASPGEQEPYQTRRIVINTKNPDILDLHGVASAHVAREKVTRFINAAKSKRMEDVLIITGKGNHCSNGTRKKGVLLRALPGWIKDNKNVISYHLGRGGGRYIVCLTPSSKMQYDSSYTPGYSVRSRRELECQIEKQMMWEEENVKRSYKPLSIMGREVVYLKKKAEDRGVHKHIQEEKDNFDNLRESQANLSGTNTVEIEGTGNYSIRLQALRLSDFLSPYQKRRFGL